jgi:hypothetical protein
LAIFRRRSSGFAPGEGKTDRQAERNSIRRRGGGSAKGCGRSRGGGGSGRKSRKQAKSTRCKLHCRPVSLAAAAGAAISQLCPGMACCCRLHGAGSLPPPRGVGGGAGSWLGFLLFSSSATADEIFVSRWAPDQLFSADLVHQSRVPTRACCCRGQGPRAAVLATMVGSDHERGAGEQRERDGPCPQGANDGFCASRCSRMGMEARLHLQLILRHGSELAPP